MAEQLVGYVRDKYRKEWPLFREVNPISTDWWIYSFKMAGASVITHEIFDESLPRDHIVTDEDIRQFPMALLQDIEVQLENIGIGTLLLQAIIEDCEGRGHRGLEGYLSAADRDHFDKLQYWYSKNGFSIEFYGQEAGQTPNKVGRVWTIFDQD